MLKTRFRLAVAQPAITADARTNGHEVRQLMRDAAAAGARLIQFPEGMLCGYAKEQISTWEDVDWPAVVEELQHIQTLARDLRIWVVLGSAHPRAAPRRPFNSLYVISDSGDIVGRYDKRYCSHTEITHFYSAGSQPLTFEVDGVLFGCAICIEINFPELFAEYERLGVDCVLLSAYPVDQIFETKGPRARRDQRLLDHAVGPRAIRVVDVVSAHRSGWIPAHPRGHRRGTRSPHRRRSRPDRPRARHGPEPGPALARPGQGRRNLRSAITTRDHDARQNMIKHATAGAFLLNKQGGQWRLGLIEHPRLGKWMIPGVH